MWGDLAGIGESGVGWKGPVKGALVMKGCCKACLGLHLHAGILLP